VVVHGRSLFLENGGSVDEERGFGVVTIGREGSALRHPKRVFREPFGIGAETDCWMIVSLCRTRDDRETNVTSRARTVDRDAMGIVGGPTVDIRGENFAAEVRGKVRSLNEFHGRSPVSSVVD
jgi:hypothetical protein